MQKKGTTMLTAMAIQFIPTFKAKRLGLAIGFKIDKLHNDTAGLHVSFRFEDSATGYPLPLLFECFLDHQPLTYYHRISMLG